MRSIIFIFTGWDYCAICGKFRKMVKYHISYKPEKYIYSCRDCNFLEYLMRKNKNFRSKKFKVELRIIKKLSDMKKIFLLIAIIIFAVFGLSGKVFALISGDVNVDSSVSGTAKCDSSSHNLMFFDASGNRVFTFYCNYGGSWKSAFADIDNYINQSLPLIEGIPSWCLDCATYDDCFFCKSFVSNIIFFDENYIPPPTADAEILGWGASLSASAKENIWSVIWNSKITIILIFLSIIMIFWIFRIIKSALHGGWRYW